MNIPRKTQKSITLGESRQQTLSKFRLLDRHAIRNSNTLYTNKNVYYLLCQPEIFVNAYAKISKNRGSLTDGVIPAEGLIELFGLEQAEKISNKFKRKTYQWKPGKRTWIPKPGKREKRPIDTPTQQDRIVQEAIRGILEAIYEPEFQEFENYNRFKCTNYGFRPGRSSWDAVENVKLKGRRTTYVIEGDIRQAYNTVNHRKLMTILRRRISDEVFLDLIYKLLKTGVMERGFYKHSLIGTPQGGIVSPLLFNIYMFENDKAIYEKVIKPLESNKPQPQTDPTYARLVYQKNQLRKLVPKDRKSKRERTRQIKAVQKKIFNTPSQKISSLPHSALYCRYADDWILLISGTKQEAEKTKQEIEVLLQNLLGLELAADKTKVSRFDDGIKFLGFSIKMNNAKQTKIGKVLRKKTDGSMERILKRLTSRVVTINPDGPRLINRLIHKGFCKSSNRMPTAKAAWTVLDNYEIVKKYSQIIQGIYNYYAACDNKKVLNHVQYILKYSCAKTLARRKKISVREVLKRLGENMKVVKHLTATSVKNQSAAMTAEYPSNKSLVSIRRKLGALVPKDSDPFYVKTFWRTKFKVYSECCICGSTGNTVMHHLRSVRQLVTQKNRHKEKGKDFSFIKDQLKRVQIPVCKSCHSDITHGKYNKKKPIHYFNQFLARL